MRVKIIHADPEFAFMKNEMDTLDIEVIPEARMAPDTNVMAAKEHVSEIERTIRVIKERYRSLWHRLPYKTMPKLMIEEAAVNVVKWLNAFPPKGGISMEYSPRIILGQRPIDYNKHCRYGFGSYCQATHEVQPTNTPKPRTIGCIYLSPTDNIQGGHRLLNLSTAKIITRTTVKEIPIPQDVIERVELLGKRDGIKPDNKYKNRIGEINPEYNDDDDDLIAGVDDDNDDTSETSETEDETYYSENSENDDSTTDQSIESITDEEIYDIQNEENHDKIAGVRQQQTNDNPNEMQEREDDESDRDEEQQSIDQNTHHKDEQDEDEDSQTHTTPPRRSTRNTKPVQHYIPNMKGQTYQETNHICVQTKDNIVTYDDQYALVIAMFILQLNDKALNDHTFVQTYNLNQGIKKFGDKGEQAAFKEVDQLHQRECFKPINVNDLTPDQRQKVLKTLIFLTEKRDGTIKARSCADGSKQRTWMSKDDTASPTVSLESIFLTCVIDAEENRDVAVVDIPNAFIQTAHTGNKVILKIKGQLAEILCRCAPHIYRSYITYEDKIPVIYVEVLKAIYGLLESALLFYKKLRKDVERIGFKVNPYDPCVANMNVLGYQLTITWHVDDMKVSHKLTDIVDSFIDWIKMKYEDVTKVKASRGKIHDYLGVELDYSTPGEVKIQMRRYVEKMLKEFPYIEQLKKGIKTPAADHIFKVRKDGKKLNKQMKESFYTAVYQALFLSMRSRIDIQLPVAFLCTRVKDPDVDDWAKLIRMMSYLRRYKNLPTTLRSDSTHICRWYADAAFAVHKDMKSHTGYMMTMGKGAVQSRSLKQKINTKSSTEAELIAADTTTTPLLWSQWFLEEQGYNVDQSILFQDNKSTMLLEQNGKESSSKRTRHINIRYFFITDCIERNELRVEYCPTDDMLADFLTKPLQGKKFFKFRRILMNLEDSDVIEARADKDEETVPAKSKNQERAPSRNPKLPKTRGSKYASRTVYSPDLLRQ